MPLGRISFVSRSSTKWLASICWHRQIRQFRRLVVPRAGASYRPDALSPVMLAAAEPDFSGWHPVVVDEARDCVAPVAVR